MYDITLKYSNEVLRDQTVFELRKRVTEAIKRQYELRTQGAIMGTVEYPDLFKKVRKDIARMKTIIKEKESDTAECKD